MPDNTEGRESGNERLANAAREPADDSFFWPSRARVSIADASEMTEDGRSALVTDVDTLLRGVNEALLVLTERVAALNEHHAASSRASVEEAEQIAEQPVEEEEAASAVLPANTRIEPAKKYHKTRPSVLKLIERIYARARLPYDENRAWNTLNREDALDPASRGTKLYAADPSLSASHCTAANCFLLMECGDEAAAAEFWDDICEDVDRRKMSSARRAELAADPALKRRIKMRHLAFKLTVIQSNPTPRKHAGIEVAAWIVGVWNDIAEGRAPGPHPWNEQMVFPPIVAVTHDPAQVEA